MIEIVPRTVDSAFLYFHTRQSGGDEIKPFLDEIRRELPNTYIWAGDGPIEGKTDEPIMGRATGYAASQKHFWFVFPMQNSTKQAFEAASEAMGAVLVTSGGYANAMADRVMERFHIPASKVILCGHQHGSCVALAAAMMRRSDPIVMTILFDPWPLENLYLQYEKDMPATKVLCIDNMWVREREKQRGATQPLFQTFMGYGMNAEGVTLEQGEGIPDEYMFQEAARQIKGILE